VSMNDLITGVVWSAPQKGIRLAGLCRPFVVEACGTLSAFGTLRWEHPPSPRLRRTSWTLQRHTHEGSGRQRQRRALTASLGQRPRDPIVPQTNAESAIQYLKTIPD
jgi:hypothetical protein